VIVQGREQTRVARRRPDGSADASTEELVPTSEVIEVRPTHITTTGQRGTITLPSELRRNLGIEDGTPLQIIQDNGCRLIIEPLSRSPNRPDTITLAVLLEGITAENTHDEIDTGAPVGQESW